MWRIVAEVGTAEQRSEERFRHVTFLAPPSAPAGGLHQRASSSVAVTGQALLDSATRVFFHRVCKAGGVRAGRYRDTILHRRRAACLRALRVPQLAEGMELVRRKPGMAHRALGALMIGVTSFYRDPQVFDGLRPLLGPLYERRGRLDALSIGCSDGCELYSLAMLLDDEGLLAGSRLWGFDCRPEAIETARAGVYQPQSLSNLPAVLREQCLEPPPSTFGMVVRGIADERVAVAGRLRDACQWAVADVFRLGQPPHAPARVDLILCRNLAIYLTPEAGAELWDLLCARLLPGGLLVVGRAERPSGSLAGHLTRISPCIYRKEGVS